MPETVALGQEHSILAMILGAGAVVQGVLLLLIVLSILSWAITIAKALQMRRAKADSQEFERIFWDSRNFARIDDSSRRLEASPLTHVFRSGFKELTQIMESSPESRSRSGDFRNDLDYIGQALRRAEFEEGIRLERGVVFLATVASAAPFIGLFGTVWGIMNAFHGLGSLKSTTLQAVAPGISEALVATAVGLAAAIPAAIAYNYFVVAVKRFKESMEKFSSEFLNVAQRYILK